MGDFVPTAVVVADSAAGDGCRLTTMQLAMHYPALLELLGYRAFSRTLWPLQHGTDTFPAEWYTPGLHELSKAGIYTARQTWDRAREQAVHTASTLGDLGLHPDIALQALAPFAIARAVVTGVRDAYRHLFDTVQTAETVWLVAEMRAALRQSKPDPLRFDPEPSTGGGILHMPYVTDDEKAGLNNSEQYTVAVGRCISGPDLDIENAIDLYQQWLTRYPMDLSPLEHVAMPARPGTPQEGNFPGWVQIRHLFEQRGPK